MKETKEKYYLKSEEVAEILDVNPETVRRWLRSGKMEGLKINRVWRVPVTEVPAYARKKDPLDK
jgi:excisionase family DNA binding protein